MKLYTVVVGLITLHLVTVAVSQDAAARKRYAETLREETVTKSAMPTGFNVSADGPDATLCVVHRPGVTLPMCNKLANQVVVADLKKWGFTYLVCTDDGNTKFTFDLTAASSHAPTKALSNDDVIQMVSLGMRRRDYRGNSVGNHDELRHEH
jgi:hypothetical protein